jgi:hypothetical protein
MAPISFTSIMNERQNKSTKNILKVNEDAIIITAPSAPLLPLFAKKEK